MLDAGHSCSSAGSADSRQVLTGGLLRAKG